MNWKEFQSLAQNVMSQSLGVRLTEGSPSGFPKKFDMLSSDQQIVGDAKFLTLVQGKKVPPAKFMEIAGHVWLLERVPAKHRFLIFGNDRRVPGWWLMKYGALVHTVEFYFLGQDGRVEKLN